MRSEGMNDGKKSKFQRESQEEAGVTELFVAVSLNLCMMML